MPHPQIQIIGAGISGLVLARSLLHHHGIKSFTISDKSRNILSSSSTSSHHPRNNHAITLHPASYRPLLPILGLDDAEFKRAVAVDCGVGGVGRIAAAGGKATVAAEGFRANRGKFENLLAEGVEVGWEREVEGIITLPERSGGGVEVRFTANGDDGRGKGEVWSSAEAGEEVIVVGADGPHSVVRRAVAPEVELEVLPFAVYNGKREYGVEEAGRKFGTAFDEGNVLEERFGDVRLGIGIDERTGEKVRLGYTFSRPAREGEDALFRPKRSKSAATDIPEALFEEVSGLRDKMDGVFGEVFDVDEMRKDRLLNWLMRRVNVGRDVLLASARRGIVLIGDSVHAEPILGGQGANEAIQDGLILAENIASGGYRNLQNFYEARHATWTKDNMQSKHLIGSMHSKELSNL